MCSYCPLPLLPRLVLAVRLSVEPSFEGLRARRTLPERPVGGVPSPLLREPVRLLRVRGRVGGGGAPTRAEGMPRVNDDVRVPAWPELMDVLRAPPDDEDMLLRLPELGVREVSGRGREDKILRGPWPGPVRPLAFWSKYLHTRVVSKRGASKRSR